MKWILKQELEGYSSTAHTLSQVGGCTHLIQRAGICPILLVRGTPGQIHRRYGVKKSENLKMGMSPLGMGTCCTPGGKHVYSVYLHPFSEATRASQTNLNSRHIFFHSLVLETNDQQKLAAVLSCWLAAAQRCLLMDVGDFTFTWALCFDRILCVLMRPWVWCEFECDLYKDSPVRERKMQTDTEMI